MEEDLRGAGPLDVLVTHVRDDGKWLKLFVQFDRVAPQQIQTTLNNISDSLNLATGYLHQCQLPVGTLIYAKHRGKWLRAKVFSWTPSNQNTVRVQFIDYGFTDIVAVTDLRKADSIFDIDPFAVECYLADISAGLTNETWSVKALEFCESLVVFKENVTCKVIKSYEDSPIIRVYINNILLIHTLWQSGYGIPLSNSSEIAMNPTPYNRQSTTPPGFTEPASMYQQLLNNSYTTPSPPPILTYSRIPLEQRVFYNVYVSFIDPQGKFFIQLCDREHDRQNMIRELLMASPSISALDTFRPGTPCVAFCNEERAFQRAVVLSFSGNECPILYVDTGVKDIKYPTELRAIPRHFLTLPAQAYECSLGPLGNSIDLNVFSQAVTGKVLQCQVVNTNGNLLIVNLFYDNRNLISIMNSHQPLTIPRQPLTLPRQQSVMSATLPGYRYIKLSAEHSFTVITTYFASPSELYCQLEENSDQIEQMMEHFIQFYGEHKRGTKIEKEQCVAGSAVCCLYEGDSSYYRAEVIEPPSDGKVLVRLVDYGNYLTVALHEINKLQPEFLSLPAQALKFTLYGLEKYPESILNSKETVKRLEKLTYEKTLVAEVVEVQEDRKYSVILRTTDQNNPLIINNLLAEENIKVSLPFLNHKELIIITNYNSPNDFFGQLSQVTEEEFTAFGDSLHNYYSSLPADNFAPVVNQYVCTQFSENQTYYRAKVLSVNSGSVEVFYIDYGNKETKGLQNIFHLTPEFAKFPQMGVCCGFNNILKDLTKDQINKLKEEMPDSELEVEFIGDVGGIFQVQLTKNTSNEEIWKILKPAKVQLAYNIPTFIPGALESVLITDVCGFDKFSCQIQRNTEQLDEMMEALDTYYKSLPPMEKVWQEPVIGAPCIAKYSADEGWYRAQVTDIPLAGKYNVYFVDYGNSELVPACDVKEIQENFVTLPLYAVQCSLANVTESNVSPNDVPKFKEQIMDKILTGIFTGQDPNTKRHKVDLLKPNGDSLALSFIKLKVLPKNTETPKEGDMWGESASDSYSRENRYNNKSKNESQSRNWHDDRSSNHQGEGDQPNSFRSGGRNQHDSKSKGERRDSDRSDESQGKSPRSITKKNIDDIPILVDYHYPEVNLMSYIDIVVTHVVNPREFYAQQSGSSSQLLALIEEMSEFYGNGAGRDNIPKMKPGDPCAALNPEDNIWYRSIVYNMLGHNIEVHLVDYGNVECVPLANVKQLKPQFFKLPIQAFKLGLPNVAPPDGRTWPVETIDKFKERVIDKCIVALFLESKGKGSFTVNLLDADKLQIQYLDQELISSGVCAQDSNNQNQLPRISAKDIKIEQLSVPLGTTSTVSITWFKSYTQFYCQIESQPFSNLMIDLQSHYNNLAVLDKVVDRPLPNMHCVTQFSEDNGWYRAQIMYTKRNKVGLFYVDYGNCEEVTRKYVKFINSGFEKIPQQAVLCSLKGVKSDETPTPEAIEKIYGGALTCSFIEKIEGGYLVEVFNNGESIADNLVKNGFAKSLDTKPKMAYVPAQSDYTSMFNKMALKNEEYEVIAIYTESPQKFYCQQANASIQLDELMERIQSHYVEKPDPVSNVVVGLAYVAKYSEDDKWYRATIMSVIENEAEVKFVDYGNQELVPKTMICECLPEFMELPAQAFECCLYGVSSDVPATLSDSFLDTVDNKELVIDIHDLKNGVYLVSVFDKSGEIIVDVGVNIFGPPLPYPQVSDSAPSVPATVKIQNYPPLVIPKGQHNVYVSHVDSPENFYIQLQSLEDLLNQVVEDLTLAENSVPVVSNVTPGMSCCAKYSEDDLFYRAVVLNVENQQATVRFIDYGNTDVCDVSSLTIPSENLLRIPPMAMHCSLKGFKVVPAAQAEAIEKFNEITVDKLLSAKFYNDNQPLQVDIFDEETNLGESLRELNLLSVIEANLANSKSYLPVKVPTDLNSVYVSHVNSVNSFFIQLVSQTSVLDLLQEELSNINIENSKMIEDAQPGTICCAKFSEDDNLYRAVVLEVTGELCKVRFVDYGNCDFVKIGNLLQLPDQMINQAPLAIECTLNDFEAVPAKEDDAINEFHTLVEDKEIMGKFLSSEFPVRVELLIENQNIAQSLKEKNLIREVETNDATQNKVSEVAYIPWFFPPETDAVPMSVVHVASLSKFYLQLWDKTDELSILGSALNEFFSKPDEMVLEEIFVGMPCVAKFSADELWYRAEVKSMENGMVTVFFVDYGNEDVVSLENVKKIIPEFLTSPPYAIECQFKKLRPVSDVESEATEEMSEITFERKMIVKFLTLTEMPYDVEMTVDGETSSIAERLILDGLAQIMVPEVSVPETTTSEKPAQKLIDDQNESESTNFKEDETPLASSLEENVMEKAEDLDITSQSGLQKFLRLEVPLHHKSHATVSHSISPSEFYLNLISEASPLENMMAKLMDVYSCLSENEMSLTNPVIGQLCVGLYVEDLHWYRCDIREILSQDITVYFVDYGNVVNINKLHIKAISSEFMTLPAQAIKCSLHGVFKLTDEESNWNRDVCDELSSCFEKEGEARVFLTEFIELIKDTVSVKLLDLGLNVAKILEAKGLVHLEKEIQFPSVSSTDQVEDQHDKLPSVSSTDQVEDQHVDSSIIRPPSREDKIVPGSIAMGMAVYEVPEEMEENLKKTSPEDKLVPGSVTYLLNEEVFSSSPDTTLDESEVIEESQEINQIQETNTTPIPRPLSRDDKMLPGLLSQGLMDNEHILELQEAYEKTPKDHMEKILPGTLHRDVEDEENKAKNDSDIIENGHGIIFDESTSTEISLEESLAKDVEESKLTPPLVSVTDAKEIIFDESTSTEISLEESSAKDVKESKLTPPLVSVTDAEEKSNEEKSIEVEELKHLQEEISASNVSDQCSSHSESKSDIIDNVQ